MANKEIAVPFDKIRDPHTITQFNEKLFKDNDLNVHHNEIGEIVDDHDKQVRVYRKIKKVKYFGPWSQRG